MKIVDCDVHIHEPPQELAEFCEMPYKIALQNVEPFDESRAGSGLFYNDLVQGLSTPGEHAPEPMWPGGENRPNYVVSPSQLRKDLTSLGIDEAVLFPDLLLKLAMFNDEAYAMAIARAYNKWMLNKWLSESNGFYGAICIAPQDPEGSAEEIRKLAGEKKMVCVYLPAAAVNPLYGNRKYYPIYEAAEKAGIPVVLHGLAVVYPVFPCQLDQFGEVGVHAFGHSLEMLGNLAHMMINGIPERFPKLKIGFMEGGIGWVAYIKLRLANEYSEWRGRLMPFLKEPPGYYFKRNLFFATQPIEEPDKASDYVKLLELIDGNDNVLFASDWPHHDFDNPSKLLSYPIPEEIMRKIMSENAERFFNLKSRSE